MIINAIAIANGGGGSSKPPVLEELNATSNGTYTPNTGVDGFSPVNVNVQPPLQTKAIEITANGQSTIVPDSEYYGLESVGVNVNVQPSLQAKSTSTTITSNGTSTITLEPDSNYDGLSSASVGVNVNVPIPTFETEELVATANGTYTPSTNGYSKVRVNVSEPVSKYVVPNGLKFAYSALSDFSNLDFSAVRDWDYMFYNCANLQEIDASGFNLSEETTLMRMFGYCSSLSSIITDGLDTSNIEIMTRLFQGCTSLKNIDLSQCRTSKLTNISYLFSGCSGLTSVDMSGWDLSGVVSDNGMTSAFQQCSSLTDLNMDGVTLPATPLSIGLNSCTALTVDSLVSVLNALPQLEGTSYTCIIGSTNLAKLSDEQKAIATNKHWTLN